MSSVNIRFENEKLYDSISNVILDTFETSNYQLEIISDYIGIRWQFLSNNEIQPILTSEEIEKIKDMVLEAFEIIISYYENQESSGFVYRF